jgi:hypothetical protein
MPRIPSPEERLQQVRRLISQRGTAQGRISHLSLRAIFYPGDLGILGCCDFMTGWVDEQQLVALDTRPGTGSVPYWELTNGEYLLQFNETLVLADNEMAILRPLDQLLASGATHPIVCLSELSEAMLVPMLVSQPGVRINQHARISMVTIVPI